MDGHNKYMKGPQEFSSSDSEDYEENVNTDCNRMNIRMNKLKSLCNAKDIEIIFDSDVDGEDNKVLSSRLLNRKNFYLLVVDKNDDIFGIYCQNKVRSFRQDNCLKYFFSFNCNGQHDNFEMFEARKNCNFLNLYDNGKCMFSYEGMDLFPSFMKSKMTSLYRLCGRHVKPSFTTMANSDFNINRIIAIQSIDA